MSGYDASARRKHHLWLAGQYGQLSRSLAAGGETAAAVACQLTGDSHRAIAALWGKASSAPQPRDAFFDLASDAMWGMARSVRPPTMQARGLVERMRRAWQRGLEPLNVPVFFPPPDHLPYEEPVIPASWARQVLSGLDWREWVQRARSARLDGGSGDAVRAGVLGAMVETAGRLGDDEMLTVAACWRLICALAHEDSVDELLRTTREVLGPVAWTRVRLFLQDRGAQPALLDRAG